MENAFLTHTPCLFGRFVHRSREMPVTPEAARTDHDLPFAKTGFSEQQMNTNSGYSYIRTLRLDELLAISGRGAARVG